MLDLLVYVTGYVHYVTGVVTVCCVIHKTLVHEDIHIRLALSPGSPVEMEPLNSEGHM